MTTVSGPSDPSTHRAALTGLHAAVTTPTLPDGALDLATFERHVELLFDAGVDGICLGGATAEYPHFELRDRLELIRRAARLMPRGKTLLVGIGAGSLPKMIELGRSAFDHGARAALVPMPLFFRYQQQDLYAYSAAVAKALQAPCLLYDLPVFTNPLESATVLALLAHEEHIVGIKDSSGRAERLAPFIQARGDHDWTFLIGDDSRLAEGLSVGWDGGVSGLASCCPELLVSIHRAAKAGDAAGVARGVALMDELIGQISGLPVPWGIRVALEARGLSLGPLPWPVAADRLAHVARMKTWMPGWLTRVQAADWSHVSTTGR
jgi:4-hydroxy-tetrahydrodipicolinate synthase